MHSSMISDSLRKHACRQQQSRTRTKGSGPVTDPDIYVGVEKLDDPGHIDIRRTRELFSVLNRKMQENFPWTPEEGPYNPTVPSGYTYLGQLVSHDLFAADNQAPSLRDPANRRNLRTEALALETVYGDNPELNAQVFERAPDQLGVNHLNWPRTRFRLDGVGHEVNDWSRDTSRCPRRDIGRIRDVRFGHEYGCPLIADERNDDHAIISQLTALFQLAHNTILDLIEWSEKPSDPLDSANNFATAKAALSFVYRRIVQDDLLARLIDPFVREHYEGSDDPGRFILSPPKGSVLTPDFLNAAFRIGHSMVRSEYAFNNGKAHNLPEIMRNSSFRAPGRTPLQQHWIVAWSHFFDIEGAAHRPQDSRRISPRFVAALGDSGLFPDQEDDPNEPSGLAYRDMLRTATTGVLKIDAIADRVCEKAPDLAEKSDWISDGDLRRKALSEWISSDGSDDQEGIRSEFVNNPPPNVYYLLEAAEAKRGTMAGPLGSIVLAETFYRALDGKIREAEMESAAAEIFGKDVPNTMPALIAWIDRHMRTEDKVFDDRALPLV